MKKDLLIIFIKNPISGKVKTRLAATLGDEKALEIYQMLLQHTRNISKGLLYDKAVFYDSFIDENDIWENADFLKFKQEGDELGKKMENAFIKGFSLGYENVCIIGSDCYELNESHLYIAFEEIKTHDIVLGPSNDGGYYLLGMKKLVIEFFHNKNWSTSSVFKDTLQNIEALQLTYSLLENLNDIDEEKDLPMDLKRYLNINKV